MIFTNYATARAAQEQPLTGWPAILSLFIFTDALSLQANFDIHHDYAFMTFPLTCTISTNLYMTFKSCRIPVSGHERSKATLKQGCTCLWGRGLC